MINIQSFLAPVRALRGALGNACRIALQKRAVRACAKARPRNIIVGAAGIGYPGWVVTDREVIDLLREETWGQYFVHDSLDAILAEHVWEHLSPEEAATAARNCHRFLRPGGYLRIAVPDGLHPDRSYIDAVKPNGSGAGADDHKVLYDYHSLSDVFTSSGFQIRLYEYFDESGTFHHCDWDPADGMIQRSRRFDSRNSTGRLAYTSIILDAVKPPEAPTAQVNALEMTKPSH